MVLRRLVPVALVALTACAQAPSATGPQPLVPRNGPDGHVRVEYDGSVFSRRLAALFGVKQSAYVMVAHLGGDGVVRVLFPEDARESGYVRGGRTYRTDVARGDYDAAPGYWFMRPAIHRSMSARSDSYDGNGHGFVFMISSASPLRFDRISEYGLWNEPELPGYANALDPRTLIRQFANIVAPSGRYTLDYASSMSSVAVHSYAQQRMDCAMLSTFLGFDPWRVGMIAHGGWYGSDMRMRGCGSYDRRYASRYGAERYAAYGGWAPVGTAPLTPGSGDSVATPRPLDPRTGRRAPLAPGRPTAVSAYRPAPERVFDRERRTRRSGDRVYPAPSTPRFDPSGIWNDPHRERGASPRRHDGHRTAEPSSGRPSEPSSSRGAESRPAPRSLPPHGGRGSDKRPDASPTKDGEP